MRSRRCRGENGDLGFKGHQSYGRKSKVWATSVGFATDGEIVKTGILIFGLLLEPLGLIHKKEKPLGSLDANLELYDSKRALALLRPPVEGFIGVGVLISVGNQPSLSPL